MSTEPKIDPHVTPVWALYADDEEAQVIHACLPRYGEKSDLPSRMWSDGGRWTSRSRWYNSREELVAGEKLQAACKECGSPYGLNWCDPYPKLLVEANLCFSCYHWTEALARINKPGQLRIDGTCYSYNVKQPIVKIDGNGAGYGHGGRRFCIRLKSGETVETNNLWCGGRVPARFKDRFPDNASFERVPAPIGHGQGFLS